MKIIVLIIAAVVLSAFFGMLANSSDEADRLIEDLEQEEYLKKWKEKQNGEINRRK